MHAGWWLFRVVLIGVFSFCFEGVGQAAGEITPQQDDERQALPDRDAGKRDDA